MQKKYDVYAIGNALVDTEIEVTDHFLEQMQIDKGLMTLVDEPRQRTLTQAIATTPVKRAAGGSACNTVVAVARFGGTAFYSCQVADDADGHFYRADLTEAGVHNNLRDPLPSGTTGKCLVLITPDAQRSMNTFLGISANIDESSIHEAALHDSKWVYLEGYLAGSDSGCAAAAKLRRLAHKAGIKTALTFSDAAMLKFCRSGIDTLLGDGVDLLFCNEEEAKAYVGCDNTETALAALKPLAKEVMLTRSEKGAWLWDGVQRIDIPATPVKAIDSNGAGDMFAGAYLYAITQGWSHTKAGHLAAKAAARVVSQFGPRLNQATHQHLLAQD